VKIRHAFGLAVLALALIPAVAGAKTSMRSPATTAIGSRVTIEASGLTPGHYTLELVFEALRGGAGPTNCVGTVGSATAHAGRVTISGKLPTHLACYMGAGPVEGYQTTKPGTYNLTLGVSFHANGFSNTSSFIIRKVHLTA
jgi:hypothetical protein